jgi:hypothetical protein
VALGTIDPRIGEPTGRVADFDGLHRRNRKGHEQNREEQTHEDLPLRTTLPVGPAAALIQITAISPTGAC